MGQGNRIEKRGALERGRPGRQSVSALGLQGDVRRGIDQEALSRKRICDEQGGNEALSPRIAPRCFVLGPATPDLGNTAVLRGAEDDREWRGRRCGGRWGGIGRADCEKA